jgi:hypothetical protein
MTIFSLLPKPNFYKKILANRAKYQKLDLYEWMMRIPSGSHQVGAYAWIKIERVDNSISLDVSTHEDRNQHNKRSAIHIKMDNQGIKTCVNVEYSFSPLYVRSTIFGINNQENLVNIKKCINSSLALIVKKGGDFYDNPMIDSQGNIVAEYNIMAAKDHVSMRTIN